MNNQCWRKDDVFTLVLFAADQHLLTSCVLQSCFSQWEGDFSSRLWKKEGRRRGTSRFMEKEEHGSKQSGERQEDGKKKKGKTDERLSFSREVTSESISRLTEAAGDWQLDSYALFIKQICPSCLSHLMKMLITGTEMRPEDIIDDLFQLTKCPIHRKMSAWIFNSFLHKRRNCASLF